MNLPVRPPAAESRAPITPFSEPWLSNLRRGLGRTGTEPVLMRGFSINRNQHRQIGERLSTLEKAITASGSDRQAIGIELAKLVSTFPSQDNGEVAASMRIEAYSDALRDAPAWAVREARLRIVRGEVSGIDQRFAPSPPQFAGIVNELVKPFRADVATLRALASIEPEATVQEHAWVVDGFAALRAELAPAAKASTSYADADAALRKRARENGYDPGILDTLPDQQSTGSWQKARVP